MLTVPDVTRLATFFGPLRGGQREFSNSFLGLMTLAIILLMAPAAYHRIVEEGQDTEHFHRFASRILIAAMIPLALGICGDLFVVVRKVAESTTTALISAGLALLFFYGLWFGYTIYRRSEHQAKGKSKYQSSSIN